MFQCISVLLHVQLHVKDSFTRRLIPKPEVYMFLHLHDVFKHKLEGSETIYFSCGSLIDCNIFLAMLFILHRALKPFPFQPYWF